MSRIHEALKKIERDRALRKGNRDETADVADLYTAQPATLPAESAPAQNTQETPSFVAASPATTDTLARCTQGDWKPQPTMLFLNGQQAVFGNEEFRTLRSRLHQLQEHRPLRKLLVTSPLPEEGKTFVAANLAQAIACQDGKCCLLTAISAPAASMSAWVLSEPPAFRTTFCMR